jgi:hypothetical protein
VRQKMFICFTVPREPKKVWEPRSITSQTSGYTAELSKFHHVCGREVQRQVVRYSFTWPTAERMYVRPVRTTDNFELENEVQ